MKPQVLAVALLALLLGVLISAQNSVQTKQSGGQGGPRVMTRNKNSISQVEETQEKTDDNWEADELKKVREATVKNQKEESYKRVQDKINLDRETNFQEGLKEKANKMFLKDLDRSQEQAKKRSDEETVKNAANLQRSSAEDTKKFEAGVQHVRQVEELNKQKIASEKEKIELLEEQGEKKRREMANKAVAEETIKEETDKRRAQLEQSFKQARETIQKDLQHKKRDMEQKQKGAEAEVEEANKALAKKDQDAAQQVAKKQEEAKKETKKQHEEFAKKAEKAADDQKKAEEQKHKKCVPVQVWSAAYPHNVWQFKYKDTVYNQHNQGFRRGYNLLVLNPGDYGVRFLKSYDTYASKEASKEMANDLSNTPDNSIIMIACQDECSNNRESTLVAQFLKLKLRFAARIGFRDSYAAIAVKGKAGAIEQWPKNNQQVSVQEVFNC